MLRRHLDVAVYDDSDILKCAHCGCLMDAQGDHATGTCRKGFGVTHRHRAVVRTLGPHLFRMARRSYAYEVPLLIPNTSLRPADILVQSGPPPPGDQQELPTAYDVTIRSPFVANVRLQAAMKTAGAAEAAHNDKVQKLRRSLQTVTGTMRNTPIAALNFKFVPLAFDTLGAPSAKTRSVIKDYAQQIAYRSSVPYETVKRRITQRISYAIWSSTASAILLRTPALRFDLQYSPQV